MKNKVYLGVIVVCVLVAALVFVKTHPKGMSGADSISENEQIWVKCTECGAAYQMGKREYFRLVEEKATVGTTPMMFAPKLPCRECGKDGIRRAFKCENCGEISFEGSVPGDFADRCPKCKYSKTEADREARLKERAGK